MDGQGSIGPPLNDKLVVLVSTLDGFPGSPGNPAPGGPLQEATTVNVQTRRTKSAITLLFSNEIVTWTEVRFYTKEPGTATLIILEGTKMISVLELVGVGAGIKSLSHPDN
eukprot:sb/3477150/